LRHQGGRRPPPARPPDAGLPARPALPCVCSKRAKSLLTDIGAAYKAVELDTMDDGKAIRAELANLTDRTSVPQIWINGEFVGGCK